MKVLFLNRAQTDLDEIWHFVALDSPKAATQLIEIGKGLRSWVCGTYVAYYRVTRREVQIVRVLHKV